MFVDRERLNAPFGPQSRGWVRWELWAGIVKIVILFFLQNLRTETDILDIWESKTNRIFLSVSPEALRFFIAAGRI